MKPKIRIDRWIILVLMGLSIALFLVYSQYHSWNDSSVHVMQGRERLAMDWQEFHRLQVLAQKGEEMEAQLSQMKSMLPLEPQEDILVLNLRKEADRNGVKLIDIAFSSRQPKDEYVEIPFSMVVEGRYFNSVQFIRCLETHSRTIRIDQFNIAKGRADLPALRTEIRASAFHRAGEIRGSGRK